MRYLLFLASVLFACTSTSALGAEYSKQKANLAVVKAFYQKALNEKDYDAAAVYMGANYTQHNPMAAPGLAGFKAFLTFLKARFPDAHSEIKASFADGDFVILHVLGVWEPGTRGTAVVGIFRLDSGKIVEHWDVRQDIPEHSDNPNGMF